MATRIWTFAVSAVLAVVLWDSAAAQESPATPTTESTPATADSKASPKAEAPAAEAQASESTSPSGPLPGHSYHGEVFDEGPRQQAYLMTGMPKIHFPATTKSPEAQAFIEQGVGQLHGFWYYEAERSFRQAAALDKNCALAYWGMAQANIENPARAKEFMAQCVKYKAGVSDRERMYIDAAEAYFKADKDKKKERNEAYTKALEKILHAHPDDIEARAFLALQLWKQRTEGPAINSFLAVDALLDQVFQANPMHPAHHYRIHLWDAERAENALASAALCGQSSPGIAHMWHMPGHIYSKTKRYADACWQQEASARVDHAHMLRDRVMPDQIHNYAHNNEWLIRDLVFVGRLRDAVGMAKNMCDLPRHPKYNTLAKGSAKFGRLRLMEVLTRFELWDELIAVSQTSYLEPTDVETEQIARLRAVGTAYFRRGDSEQGNAQLAALEQKLTEKKAAQEKPAGEAENQANIENKANTEKKGEKAVDKAKADAKKQTESLVKDLTKAISELKGHQSVAAGEFKVALDHFKDTGLDQDYLAVVQFKAGQADKALETAQAAVRSRKNEVIPLARLVELTWLAGKRDDAKTAFDQLRELSGSIDETAPFYSRLAPIAKELGYSEHWKVVKPPLPDTGTRPPLDWLGPLYWQPAAAPAWSLADVQNRSHSLGDYHGKPVLVLFYLGYGCLHCAKQLQAFGDAAPEIRAAGIDIVAISSDDAAGLQQSLRNYHGAEIPFPLLADSRLDAFKSYRCFDDFEQQPLHGTFLIDASGLIRWQDIGPEPFMDTKFLLTESQRLLAQ